MPVLEDDLHLGLGQHSDNLNDLADGHIVIDFEQLERTPCEAPHRLP